MDWYLNQRIRPAPRRIPCSGMNLLMLVMQGKLRKRLRAVMTILMYKLTWSLMSSDTKSVSTCQKSSDSVTPYYQTNRDWFSSSSLR